MTRIVRITKAELQADVETLTRKEMAKKYKISEAKLRETLASIGLEKTRARQVVINLVDEDSGRSMEAAPKQDFAPVELNEEINN